MKRRLSCVPASPIIWDEIREFYYSCVSQGVARIHGSEDLSKFIDDMPGWFGWLYTESCRNNSSVMFTVDTTVAGLVGVFCIRDLTPKGVRNGAYHYGHTVRPDLWNRGYGKEQLQLGMSYIAMRGNKEMLLSVKPYNLASIGAIKAVGGTFLYSVNEHDVYSIPIWS